MSAVPRYRRTTSPAAALLAGALLLLSGAGCTQTRPPAPKPVVKRPGPPIFDGRRGGGSFPLMGSKKSPLTPADLQASLAAGYFARLDLPAGAASPVEVKGRRLNSLEAIRIDVSGARVRRDYEPTQLLPDASVLRTVRTNDLLYAAWPLVYETARLSVRLAAKDATLEVLRDSDGKTGLVLAGARDSQMEMEVSHGDLERGFLAAGRKGARRFGIRVESSELSLRSPTPRALEGAVRVKCWWLLVPMAFRVHGRMDVTEIDGEFYATFSEMGCTAENIGGGLAASFLDPMLKKLQGRTSPLARFRDEKTHVKDVSLSAGPEGLRVEMRAGR